MYSCKVIADSVNICGDRLTSLEVTFPRFILAEVNTHRKLSKSSASSRAIPSEKILKNIIESGFIPEYWGKNQKGMKAKEEISKEDREKANQIWLIARDNAISSARDLLALGVHKQVLNRIVEPFMTHCALLSGTSWENMLNLRDHPDAQPEFKKLAQAIRLALKENIPELLQPGEYHLPYVKKEEHEEIIKRFSKEALLNISCGRSCRLSYMTQHGIRDLQADYDLSLNLVKDAHLSPTEHCAIAMSESKDSGNYTGFTQFRKTIVGEDIFRG